MKRLLVFTFLLGGCLTATAQSRKSYLEIGTVRVQLGMSKAEVSEKLSDYKVLKATDSFWLVDLGWSQATFRFTDGRLSFADRSWLTKDNDPVGAILGAVNSLNREGFYACNIYADTVSDPGVTHERAWIRCGQKSLLIVKSRMGGKTTQGVYEQLGAVVEAASPNPDRPK